ncbi:MAG: hypothetical protein WAN93_13790 [Solirubrobacteraceae bacterium]
MAERLARAARAAQQLCEVLWEALHEELRHPNAERITELSERLAEVSSTVAMLAATMPEATPSGAVSPPLSAPEAPAPEAPAPEAPAPEAPAPEAPVPKAPVVERRTPVEPSRPEAAQADSRPTPDLRLAPHPSVASDLPQGAEREPEESPVGLQPIPTRAGAYTFTKLVDEHHTTSPIEPTEESAAEIEIRDVRREEGPSAWVSSVGRLLTRHAEDGLPFAVLLVEIVDVARLERSETPHDLHGLVAQVESALGRGMRGSDRLSRETLGRYWLVAPETNGTGARMLAERLARLVRTSATHRGVPLEVAIGIAVCPEDGVEAPALAARADLGVYSARATGRSISHTDPPQR